MKSLILQHACDAKSPAEISNIAVWLLLFCSLFVDWSSNIIHIHFIHTHIYMHGNESEWRNSFKTWTMYMHYNIFLSVRRIMQRPNDTVAAGYFPSMCGGSCCCCYCRHSHKNKTICTTAHILAHGAWISWDFFLFLSLDLHTSRKSSFWIICTE